MADGIIQVTADDLRGTSATLKNVNASMKNQLDTVKQQMGNKLPTAWQSDSYNAIKSKFDAFAPRFEELYTTLDAYCKFLEDVATSYDTNESTLTKQVESVEDFK